MYLRTKRKTLPDLKLNSEIRWFCFIKSLCDQSFFINTSDSFCNMRICSPHFKDMFLFSPCFGFLGFCYACRTTKVRQKHLLNDSLCCRKRLPRNKKGISEMHGLNLDFAFWKDWPYRYINVSAFNM